MEKKEKCDWCNDRGWSFSFNDLHNRYEIQRCDACGFFDSDQDAENFAIPLLLKDIENIKYLAPKQDSTIKFFSSEKEHIKNQTEPKLAKLMENKIKSMKENYLQKGGAVCPYCGSKNIGTFDHSCDYPFVTDIECYDCGKQWRDYHELHDIELVDEPFYD